MPSHTFKKKLRGKRVLITGGAGFLGSHLADRCLKEGARVWVIDDLSTGKMENLNDAIKSSHFKFIKGDANNYESLKRVFRKSRPHYAVHYAALVGVTRTQKNPIKVLRDLDGISHFFYLAKKFGVQKVVFSSSSEAYGEPIVMPSREDGPLNPQTTYGVIKVVGEEFVKVYTKKGVPGVALRFFNVYGPRQNATPYGFVVGIFIQQVLKGERPTIFGNGHQTRDFIYVDDNVEAVFRAMMSPRTKGEIINIVRGSPIRILDLAKRIIALSGKKISPKYTPPRIEGEIKHRFADGSKMKKLVGIAASTPLDVGLKKTMEWYRRMHD